MYDSVKGKENMCMINKNVVFFFHTKHN